PPATQVKLLRVLEEKVIERVGENKPIPVDVRIISATNKNLNELIQQGIFREDLYFRINVIPITIPPLRDRVEDISILAESFFQRMRLKSGKDVDGISNDAMDALMRYDWPGNVRELKSAFEYAFVTCHNSMILPDHLPPNIIQNQSRGSIKIPDKDPVGRDEYKRMELMEALERTGGNQSRAARILGVSRVTIWNRMKKYNINFKRKLEI
ncbi:MAG: sigma 54-interacting transcriptional regulator, partial [Desulfobacterales bacterium]|nr:sigma 54-interacting transcriptional regulator [Desulfobacterales bacterium]